MTFANVKPTFAKEKITVECDTSEDKKHSVRYFANREQTGSNPKRPVFDSIYINREYLGDDPPVRIRVTIELL